MIFLEVKTSFRLTQYYSIVLAVNLQTNALRVIHDVDAYFFVCSYPVSEAARVQLHLTTLYACTHYKILQRTTKDHARLMVSSEAAVHRVLYSLNQFGFDVNT